MSVREYFQVVMGFKATKVRLREVNKDFTYLTRESDIKKGKLILFCPNPSVASRNNFKKQEDALSVMENMILSNDDCVHPISLS